MDPGAALAIVRHYDFDRTEQKEQKKQQKQKLVISGPTDFRKNAFSNPDLTAIGDIHTPSQIAYISTAPTLTAAAATSAPNLLENHAEAGSQTASIVLRSGRGPKRAPRRLRKKRTSFDLRQDALRSPSSGSMSKSDETQADKSFASVDGVEASPTVARAKTIKIRRGLSRQSSTFEILTRSSHRASDFDPTRTGVYATSEDKTVEETTRVDSVIPDPVDFAVSRILSRTQSGFELWRRSTYIPTADGCSSGDNSVLSIQRSRSTSGVLSFDSALGGSPMSDDGVIETFQSVGDQVSKRLARRNANNCSIIDHGRAVQDAKTLLPEDQPGQLTSVRENMADYNSSLYLNAKVTPSSSNAASRVFAIEELLEQILEDVSFRDLIACQRVNKSLRQSITSTMLYHRRLFMAPSPQTSKENCNLNPLLTTLGKISRMHPVHKHIDLFNYLPSPELNGEPTGPVFARHGRYYLIQRFYSHASNPTLTYDPKTGSPTLDLELRELSKHEASQRSLHTLFPGEESSIWKMYLCQPPPSEVRVTIWKREGSVATVSEKFVVRGWTVREILENVEEARRNEGRPKQFAKGGTDGGKDRGGKGEKMARLAKAMLAPKWAEWGM
ncbi:hypothetical protein HII31_13125 [Pseudocercospora fuligena]|uniref:F-box domain-containing protein n=1 Tax=Pseudocercospora fuligena TaxID=685502 RepID=A0A8H6R6I8_9PEZI|nr:hypothetical protein HII31_13125 [Pseudocercospora fuligena]